MMEKTIDLKRVFSPSKVLLAVFVGIGVSVYSICSDVQREDFEWSMFSHISLPWLGVSLLLMFGRDLAYMIRLTILSEGKITLRRALSVILLWEFSSALTPSVVGGSAVAVYFISKEGLSLGKSSALVMVTALLDELFYLLTVPLVLLFVGMENLIPENIPASNSFLQFFYMGYGVIFLVTVALFVGVFVNPVLLRKILIRLFSFPIIKRWRWTAARTGNEIVMASNSFKGKSVGFWLKAFLATAVSWTSRFWVVNTLILVFTPVGDHLLVYARQLIMWVILLISPTPGGSGVAEIAFSSFLKDFVPIGGAGLLAILWRLISYYAYIFAGSIILPKWLQRHYSSPSS